jgi:hypothetical protein
MAETAVGRHSVSAPTITQAAALATSSTAAIAPRPARVEFENRFIFFSLAPSLACQQAFQAPRQRNYN